MPAEIRQKIGELYDAGHTIDEIMQALEGVDASRSSLGRYVQQRDKLAADVRRSREISDSIVRNLGQKTPGKQQALLIELFHTAMLDLFLNQETGELNKDGRAALKGSPKGLSQLADALHSLARANRLDVDVRADLEKAARAAAEQEATAAVTKAARQQGLSAETVSKIMSGAFGVKK
ncbi:phage protein Gp27 family protein [Bombella apis]|uniref:phage protein Gp27 family protein n=1 Tax=Bombella apis TaxID=1785988 RepID=UPI0031F666FB